MMDYKKQLFSFLLLISFLVGVSAQATKQAATAAAIKPDAIEQNLRKHVGYLASERLEGRRTGERGATFAAGYVANIFSGYKLKGGFAETANGKTKTSFLQPFPFITGVELGKNGNEFRISVANSPAGETFQSDTAAPWKALAFSPNAMLEETPVVFAGHGITSEETKTDDYAGLDVAGKIVLVFDGTPDSTGNPHSPLARFDARAKARIARDKGARALFVISRSQRLEGDQLFGVRYDPSLGESAVPVILVSRRIAAALVGTPENDLHRVETMALKREQQALADLRAAMQNALQSRAAFQVNLAKKEAEAYNVIGILEGTDAQLKNEAVVIGAHYDHLGRGGRGSLAADSTQIHHGADDNASGVAALLELARQFAQEKKNKRTIIFVAFGGEEAGLIGSKHYVNNPVFPLDKTVAMINLDMVGRLNENKLTIGGVGTASEWKNLIEYRNTLTSSTAVNPTPTNLPAPKPPVESTSTATAPNVVLATPPTFNLQLNEDGFGPSDHSSFYGKQIPVLFFFTGTHTDYHKPSDTAEKINYPGLKQIVSFASDIVKSVDQNPKRPTYAQAKSSGMMGGSRTGGFNVSLGTIPSYAESSDGLVLDGVRDASPAAKAGIKAGDRIVRLAGKEIRNVSDYTFVLGEMKPDVEYEIVVVRGDERLTLKIVPAARK